MSHTKEPWSFSPAENGLEWGVEAGKWGVAICADAPGDGTSEANARRIVACVNACAGIPTDDLERCPSGGLFHLADMANEVVKQRDELLASVEKALLWNKSRKYIMPYRIRDPLLAAVISAKGGAA